MLFVNLVIFLLYAMLAILSRKHYSKYKNASIKRSFVSIVFMAMARSVYVVLYKYLPMDRIKERLRKIQVVSSETLEDLAEEYIVKNAAIGLFIMFVCAALSVSMYVMKDKGVGEASNIIEREDYTGDAKKHDIYLTVDGQTSVYELEVYPTEYTEQEFLQEVQNVEEWLTIAILGGNASADYVTEDLYLPDKDRSNCFVIQWQSQNPDIVTSYGKVERDLLTEDVVVVLTASISYLDYAADFEYPVCVRAYVNDAEKKLTKIQALLKDIEVHNRTEELLTIPKESEGVSIALKQGEKTNTLNWVLIGLLLCTIIVILQHVRLDEAVKNRDKQLEAMYSGFVSRICMLLGTGLTLRGCMEQIAYELRGHSTLKQELLYMVHELKMGRDETVTYTAFASRIGLPIYARLMNHINQNLRVGTQNLIRVLEEEVGVSLEMKNEYMKKRGEEVSTKLLFPMMVLLLVVMFIVMFPAMHNF